MLRTVVETNMNSGLGQEVPDFMKTEEELDDVGEMWDIKGAYIITVKPNFRNDLEIQSYAV